MTNGQSDCTQHLREQGKAYPRTCKICGLGLCQFTNPASTPQPAPQKGNQIVLARVYESIQSSLCEPHKKILSDLQDRATEGRKKYGVFLETHNGRDALMDLYQETLDSVMYAKQYELEQLEMGMPWMAAEAPFLKALDFAAFIKYRLEVRDARERQP